jgi:hypothetical protein
MGAQLRLRKYVPEPLHLNAILHAEVEQGCVGFLQS